VFFLGFFGFSADAGNEVRFRFWGLGESEAASNKQNKERGKKHVVCEKKRIRRKQVPRVALGEAFRFRIPFGFFGLRQKGPHLHVSSQERAERMHRQCSVGSVVRQPFTLQWQLRDMEREAVSLQTVSFLFGSFFLAGKTRTPHKAIVVGK
jgi:hypothetical protein